jgi:hypothetical protein
MILFIRIDSRHMSEGSEAALAVAALKSGGGSASRAVGEIRAGKASLRWATPEAAKPFGEEGVGQSQELLPAQLALRAARNGGNGPKAVEHDRSFAALRVFEKGPPGFDNRP